MMRWTIERVVADIIRRADTTDKAERDEWRKLVVQSVVVAVQESFHPKVMPLFYEDVASVMSGEKGAEILSKYEGLMEEYGQVLQEQRGEIIEAMLARDAD